MYKLIIVGAGGFGRETLQWALSSSDCGSKWQVMGFIDDDINALDAAKCPWSVLGTIASWEPQADERFVIALGLPASRKKVAGHLAGKGARFANVIHDTVVLAPTAKLGNGVVLCPNVVVSDNATLGDHVVVNIHSSIGHDAVIEPYSVLSSFCDITGCVSVGEAVFVGSSVCVVPGRSIGGGAYLCAGSAVLNNVSKNTRVMGNPARKFEIKRQ